MARGHPPGTTYYAVRSLWMTAWYLTPAVTNSNLTPFASRTVESCSGV